MHNGKYEYPDLIDPIRERLIQSGLPYAIENVPGAPLINPVTLCGSMFGLKLIRHRLFECNPPLTLAPASHACRGLYTNTSKGYSSFANGATAICVAGHNFNKKDAEIAMGIDWMTRDELAEAIPPAYTRYIGKFLMRAAIEREQ
jgi:DNA (cytosine-5)-methyltransferase 1